MPTCLPEEEGKRKEGRKAAVQADATSQAVSRKANKRLLVCAAAEERGRWEGGGLEARQALSVH